MLQSKAQRVFPGKENRAKQSFPPRDFDQTARIISLFMTNGCGLVDQMRWIRATGVNQRCCFWGGVNRRRRTATVVTLHAPQMEFPKNQARRDIAFRMRIDFRRSDWGARCCRQRNGQSPLPPNVSSGFRVAIFCFSIFVAEALKKRRSVRL